MAIEVVEEEWVTESPTNVATDLEPDEPDRGDKAFLQGVGTLMYQDLAPNGWSQEHIRKAKFSVENLWADYDPELAPLPITLPEWLIGGAHE